MRLAQWTAPPRCFRTCSAIHDAALGTTVCPTPVCQLAGFEVESGEANWIETKDEQCSQSRLMSSPLVICEHVLRNYPPHCRTTSPSFDIRSQSIRKWHLK